MTRMTPVPLAAIERISADDLRRLLDAERRGRLVEADELDVLAERPGDGDGLPLTAGERPHEHVLVPQRDAERGEPGAALVRPPCGRRGPG